MARKARSTAVGPMGFILGLCHREHAREHRVRGRAFGPGPVAVLVGCYGGDLRVVLGAARCEEVDRDKILSCPVSTSKKNAPGRLFYQERYAFELWHVCQALGSQRLADHALGVFDE